jgi:hypothetical protein
MLDNFKTSKKVALLGGCVFLDASMLDRIKAILKHAEGIYNEHPTSSK